MVQGAPSPQAFANQIGCSAKPVSIFGEVLSAVRAMRCRANRYCEAIWRWTGTAWEQWWLLQLIHSFYARAIEEAKARKPQGRNRATKDYTKVKTWLMHVRVAGCMQRAGLVCVRPMPCKVVPLGSSPPKESLADIQAAQVQNRVLEDLSCLEMVLSASKQKPPC